MITTNTAKRSEPIERLDYDPLGQRLHVTFKTGGTYTYRDVTPAMHTAALAAPSLGKWFNDNLWGKRK